MSVLVDRGTNDCYVLPAKAAGESTARLLPVVGKRESLTANTGGFRADDPPEDDEEFDCGYVVHRTGNALMETFT